LWAAVAADAGPWTGGEEAAAQSTLTHQLAAAVGQAGELVALLQGRRGVCLLQLWTAKDGDTAGAVYNPLALRALRQVRWSTGALERQGFGFRCRWSAAERVHPTDREMMGSTTLRTLQDPILLKPWPCF
jgi:hypothetical protein